MKLLFISRTYPPLIGGMEKFASDFYNCYRKRGRIDMLANSGGKEALPFFLIKVFFYLIFLSRRYDVIHLYDGVLAPLVWVIRLVSNAKVSLTVNGLDVVYARFGYQKFAPYFLGQADRIIAISNYTMEQCRIRGIPERKLTVIPIGCDLDAVEILSEEKRFTIMSRLGVPLGGKKILLTVGRLVKRKGHAWFIENVLKELPNEYIYLLVGSGPERDSIADLVRNLDLTGRVYLLGRVSDEEKNCLYQVADLFVMPNVRVENDQEGFGIVLLEAGLNGLPVVASNIEGIRDVVIDHKTGLLVDENDSQGFINAIFGIQIDRLSISASLLSRFAWDVVIQRYYEEFEKLKSG